MKDLDMSRLLCVVQVAPMESQGPYKRKVKVNCRIGEDRNTKLEGCGKGAISQGILVDSRS